MKYIFFFLFVSLVSSAADREVPKSLREKMRSFEQSMNKLLPIAFSNNPVSEKEATEIKKNVSSMLLDLKDLEGHFSLGDSRTPFMTSLLNTQLSELNESLNDRSFDYAKSITKSIPKICVSCHLQDRVEVLHFSKLPVTKFDDQLSYAEYLEMIRDFEAAEKVYTSVLMSSKATSEDKNQALNQLLTLEIRVFNVPEKTIKKFLSLEGMIKDPKIKSRLATINSELMSFNKKTEFNFLKLSDKNIEAESALFEQKLGNLDSYLLNDEDLVNSLVFLSNLYDYTNNLEQQKHLPIALYFISVLEKKHQQSLFYSLSDLYLRKCIKEFTKHDYARKCFDKYKQLTLDSFTGTRGTDLPASVKKELDQFQALFKDAKP
jgi:hypothetical protein